MVIKPKFLESQKKIRKPFHLIKKIINELDIFFFKDKYLRFQGIF